MLLANDLFPRPPAAPDVEERLLSALLDSHVGVEQALAADLTAEDFARPIHRVVYRRIVELHQAGQPHGPIDVRRAIETSRIDAGELTQAGGAVYLHRLWEQRAPADWVEADAKTLRDLGDRRRLADAGLQAVQLAAQVHVPLDHVRQVLQDKISPLPGRGDLGSQFAGKLLSVTQLMALEPPPSLVDDLLFSGTLAVVYGPPGASKSFLALDLAMCVAAGYPWQGREVTAGRVLYVAAEGGAGLSARVRAWVTAYDATPERFHVYPDAVNLLERAHVDVVMQWAMVERPVLVVLDTLARSMVGGDENTAQDMGLAVDAAERISAASGATVILVHHSTKDGVSLRGSSALLGAADTVIEVKADGAIVSVECRKQKDAEQFATIRLQRVVVELEPGNSCVLRALAPLQEQRAPERHMEAVLQELVASFPVTGASGKELREALEMHPSKFSRAVNELLKAGKVINVGTPKRPHYMLPGSMRGGKAG